MTIPTNESVDTRSITSATFVTDITDLATEAVAKRNAFNQGLVEELLLKLNEVANLARALHL